MIQGRNVLQMHNTNIFRGYQHFCYTSPDLYLIFQVCSIIFTNWVHTKRLIEFINRSPTVNLQAFHPNGEWALLNTNTFNISMKDPMKGEFQRLGFTLRLKRIPTYFIFNITLPITFLMLLSMVVYILPAESGEKMGLQVTILLAFSLMMLILSDTTPKASTTTPLLSEL